MLSFFPQVNYNGNFHRNLIFFNINQCFIKKKKKVLKTVPDMYMQTLEP